MTNVITVPPSLDDHSFEQVLEQVAPLPDDAKLVVDARHVRWASPYGLTALLTFAQTRKVTPTLAVPPILYVRSDALQGLRQRQPVYGQAEHLEPLAALALLGTVVTWMLRAP